jgi:SAM-dependent methyltransferase
MSFSNYGELCTEVYELTKKIGQSLSGDIEFYQNKLKSCDGKVLEAMVGSGRVLIPLLEAGIKIDGADYSPEMLAACRQHCAERGLSANLYESNLQNLALSQQYEAIIIPGGSFLLIEERNESIGALRKLYEHLKPGGKLILDLFLPEPDFDVSKGGEVSTFHLPDGDLITMERKLVEANLLEQYKVYYLKYEKWRNGSLLQTELQRFALRWYGVEEFKLLLENIGFEDIQVYADYDESNAPSDAKQIFVYEATRK